VCEARERKGKRCATRDGPARARRTSSGLSELRKGRREAFRNESRRDRARRSDVITIYAVEAPGSGEARAVFLRFTMKRTSASTTGTPMYDAIV